MNFTQYLNLGNEKKEEGIFKRYPYAYGWDRTFSKIFLSVCIIPLIIFLFQWSFTPLGEVRLTKEKQVVNLGEITVITQEHKIEKASLPKKNVELKKNTITNPSFTGKFMSAVITKVEPIEDNWKPSISNLNFTYAHFDIRKESELPVRDYSGQTLVGSWTKEVIDNKLDEYEKQGGKVLLLYLLSGYTKVDESRRNSFNTFPEKTKNAYLKDVEELEEKGIYRKVKGLFPPNENYVENEAAVLGGWNNIWIDVYLDSKGEDGVRRIWVKFRKK